MSTLSGMFDPKPRSARNFLLENIREVCKGAQRKKCPTGPQKLKLRDGQPKASHPKAKAYKPPRQQCQEPTENLPVNVKRHHLKLNCVSTHIPQGNSNLSKGNGESYSQLQNEIHSSNEQSHSANVRDCLKEEINLPSYKLSYIDEENVPFRWTQVCPSIISHTVCHQAVQTINEDDFDSLLQDGSIKYPSFQSNQLSEEAKKKMLSVLEWPTYTEDQSHNFDKEGSTNRLVNLGSESKLVVGGTAGKTHSRPAPKMMRRQPSHTERGVGPGIREYGDGEDQGSSRVMLSPLYGKLLISGASESLERGSEFSWVTRDGEIDSASDRTEKTSLSQISKVDLAGSLDQMCPIVENSPSFQYDHSEKTTDTGSLNKNGLPLRLTSSQQRGGLAKPLKNQTPNVISKDNQSETYLKQTQEELTSKTSELLRVSPEQNRRRKLQDATAEYEELVAELNKMPVRTDTLRTRIRKIEIEKELDLLEKRMNALTRLGK